MMITKEDKSGIIEMLDAIRESGQILDIKDIKIAI